MRLKASFIDDVGNLEPKRPICGLETNQSGHNLGVSEPVDFHRRIEIKIQTQRHISFSRSCNNVNTIINIGNENELTRFFIGGFHRFFVLLDEIGFAFAVDFLLATSQTIEEGVIENDIGSGISPIVVKKVLNLLFTRLVLTVDNQDHVLASLEKEVLCREKRRRKPE